MDDAMRRWEAGVLAYFEGDPDAMAAGVSLDFGFGASMARGWVTEGRTNGYARLAALWLEHRAVKLDAEADRLDEIADHTAGDRLREEAQGHRGSARAIRRELLGEEVEGG